MVVVVDLDDGGISDPYLRHRNSADGSSYHPRDFKKPVWPPERDSIVERGQGKASDDRPNANLNGFSAALSCYPIVSQLASLLDLNTLHALSRTCRQFRVNLLEYRNQLVTQTLRCSKEGDKLGTRLGEKLRGTDRNWSSNEDPETQGRITSGKVGTCARDMVGECRRCGVIVCRNCTTKPFRYSYLAGRHRRLCRVCCQAPLSLHISADSPLRSPCSSPSTSPARLYRFPTPESRPAMEAFTAPAFQRGPCKCEEDFWLCTNCGQSLRAADTTYARGWTWRTKYSAYLGGLGTGIGEGNEGVECGRRSGCLAARIVEQELDCDAESLAELQREVEKVEGSGKRWRGTSFMVQEMEGVGGVVKKKVKRMVRVGQEVEEHEEEREREREPRDHISSSATGKELEREKSGEVRSWCAWCERVIYSKNDKADMEQEEKLREHKV